MWTEESKKDLLKIMTVLGPQVLKENSDINNLSLEERLLLEESIRKENEEKIRQQAERKV